MNFLKNYRIIYVDDATEYFSLFEVNLSEQWEWHCFPTPGEALRELKNINPSIILSDMRMGKVSGVEFLSEAMKIDPLPSRIIVTGFSDESLMISSIRFAGVLDYFIKPPSYVEIEVRLNKANDVFIENKRKHDELGILEARIKTLNCENTELLRKLGDPMQSSKVELVDNNVGIKNSRINNMEMELKRLNEIEKKYKILKENLEKISSS